MKKQNAVGLNPLAGRFVCLYPTGEWAAPPRLTLGGYNNCVENDIPRRNNTLCLPLSASTSNSSPSPPATTAPLPSARVKALADTLAERVRVAVVEFAKATGDETGNEDELVPRHHSRSLGRPWPPPEESRGVRPMGKGAVEYLQELMDGKDIHTLERPEKYPDGAFHVTIKADLG